VTGQAAGPDDARLAAVPVTLAVEILLKRLVHRQWEGGPGSCSRLARRDRDRGGPGRRGGCPGRARRPAVRLAVVCLTGGYALAIAVARLVETVHPLTDVLGGTATALVVTLGEALALTAVSGSERSHRASAARGR
jgi:hypothetical protein